MANLTYRRDQIRRNHFSLRRLSVVPQSLLWFSGTCHRATASLI